MTSSSSILVAARFRPLMGRELKLGTGKVSDELILEKEQGQEVVFRENKFTYDYIFGMESRQELVFAPARGMVASFCKGFNSTIFAYGQTGSGKVSSLPGMHARRASSPRPLASHTVGSSFSPPPSSP